MNTEISVTHVKQSAKVNFESFLAKLEKQLGKHHYEAYGKLVSDPAKKEEVEQVLKSQEGSSGLMTFATYQHGDLLTLKGQKRQARQYVIGNPLFAARMTEHDLRAALYAPLRLLAYVEDEGTVAVEYDLPSTLFGQFKNEKVTAVARELDEKLKKLVEAALA